MSKLHITLVQSNLYWEDKAANIRHFDSLINNINQPSDIVVLPEMFSTGFSMKPEQLAEQANSDTLQWLKQKAAQTQQVICGSVMFEENKAYYNRFVWSLPDGGLHVYNKRHLFRMGEENQHYTAGHQKSIISYKGWNILPVVCYDLRFPVWLRRTEASNYDLMIVVANWPERRSAHWKALLVARAIENQCFVVAVNRIGTDGNGVNHSGDSCIISPKGEIIYQQANEAFVQTFGIDLQEVITYRKEFPVEADRDNFQLIL